MKRLLGFGVVVAGFSSMLAQIVVLREALSGFYGNELVLGVVLAEWLFLSGLGSIFGGRMSNRIKDKLMVFALSQLLVALLVLPTVFPIKVARMYIATPGELVGLTPLVIYSTLILAPLCILTGFQFALACSLLTDAAGVYILDSVGSVFGGFIFSFVFAYFLNSFQSLYVVVALNFLSCMLLSLRRNCRKLAYATVVLFLVFVLFAFKADLQELSTAIQFPGQRVLEDINSLYGNIVVTQRDNQLNFYENAVPFFNTGNVFEREATVHYGMLEHPNPQRVLLISGGVSGTLDEILKYNPGRVDYVELDPKLIEVGLKHAPSLADRRVSVHNIDGRLFVREAGGKYDVVIVDVPEPESIQLNRFYTKEFFSEVKGVMSEGGVFSINLKGGENYLSSEARRLNSAIYTTLKEVYPNVLIVPGEVNHYLASESDLDYEFARKISERNISLQYLPYYLDGTLTPDRIQYMTDAVRKEDGFVNRDFNPVTYHLYLKYWLSLFGVDYKIIAALAFVVLAVILYAVKLKPTPTAMLAAGFSGTSVEIILLLGFQALYGYVYRQISMVVTAFMLGMIVGAYLSQRRVESGAATKKTLAEMALTIAVYFLALPVILLLLSSKSGADLVSIPAVFPVLSVLGGFLTGRVFPAAVKITPNNTDSAQAGMLYGIDLIGACFGAFATAVLLVPLLGVINVCLLIALINIACVLYVRFRG